MSPAPFGRSLLVVAAVIMTAGVTACGAGPHVTGGTRPGMVVVEHFSANGKTVHIGVGDRISLVLDSAYWKIHGSSAPMVLRKVGSTTFVAAAHSCPPGVGCGSQHAFFKALARGKAVLSAHRNACGEALQCTGGLDRFRLTVIVR